MHAKYIIAAWAVLVVVGLILLPSHKQEPSSFVHNVVINIDGEDYYFAGETNMPGHEWMKIASDELIGFHYNSGPNDAKKWWSSDAGDHQLLYFVQGIVDTWTPEKAGTYAERGFVHYHELINVVDGSPHPAMVVWLRHIAAEAFTLDRGPNPETAHIVEPGVDWNFYPNCATPYPKNVSLASNHR